jgi:hypothetical protein
MALRAAAAWGRDRWPGGLGEAIELAFSLEPVADVKKRFARVAAGEPLDQ